MTYRLIYYINNVISITTQSITFGEREIEPNKHSTTPNFWLNQDKLNIWNIRKCLIAVIDQLHFDRTLIFDQEILLMGSVIKLFRYKKFKNN